MQRADDTWEELDPIERAVLCSLYRLVWRAIGRKPRHVPLEAIAAKIHPNIRGEVRRALRLLLNKGLARKVKPKTYTLTREGLRIAESHCHRID